MAIKIAFYDTETGELLSEELLLDEEVKALETEMDAATFTDFASGKHHTGIPAWVLNLLKQKARMKADEIVERSGRLSRFAPYHEKLSAIREVEKEKPVLLKKASERNKEVLLEIKGAK